ncbi:ABC transporter substrate-binding protein [Aneurinibacillus migulanus]|uniref:Iron complex transport system substrate-binding protein n=1 Tax=Aneurinibacillus migulanus TaxID=47500 RepID=A0A0D1YDZ5_ANEMI|nr:ABC transporter substrate-binding protein [Aneurinibacillus migulanus]KIV57167.1 iron(3+)-hydroxamate-binding protein yxeB [Aneurinibacillus migulanus]KON96940.1 iron(3+)-hydroxamate-binding protein yxeB [Aneurinibacillus migulanus]MED0894309.1 ABC transporter substrate-binding protein [Aneurinibacillus migulanus]MED1619582.1 ABC transporter substrate-binding protein [Aneurinibacillus migulanus]MED4732264.1 ABC transporter substrate-binding protein [Aneurinibacillus migulanus]
MLKKKWFFSAFAIMIVFSVLVTACGGAVPTAPKETATKASTGEFRNFETVKGTVKIPVKPQRIVTDYYGGELLSVGANVVGVEPTAFDNPFLTEQLKGAQDVGEPINTEKTLALAPDLIVVMYDKNYEALSKIAPTLYIPYGTTTNIYETVKLFGDIVGEPEKAKEFIAAFDKKAAEGRKKLKGVIDENATFGLYELTDKGDIYMFGDNAGRGGQAVYNALKLKMPHKNSAKDQTLQLSIEVLPEYAADYMFLTTYDPEKKGEELKKLQASAVWKNLDAVKNNTLFYNDFDTFYRYDPIASMKQIDLIVDMLIERSKENKK